LLIAGSRGQLQWQKSFNGRDWADISGQTTEALSYPIDTSLFFRIRIKEENVAGMKIKEENDTDMVRKKDAIRIFN
jgi:hypothetical protein